MATNYRQLIRVLENCTGQMMNNALASMDLTAAQGQVIAFIVHRQEPPCARDIEEAFQLSHPTVSGILSRLEQKGFIQVLPDEQDRRCKRLYVQQKGQDLHETMHQVIRDTEQRLVEGFTAEEKEQFAWLLRRSIDNLGGHPCKRRQKEETKE